MSLVTLRSYRDPIAAELAKNRLESEGIRAAIFDDHLVAIQWLYSRAVGGVKVKVDEADLARASEVLGEDRSGDLQQVPEGAAPPGESEVCPACASVELHRSSAQRRFAAWSLLTGLPLAFWSGKFVCEACGHSWKPEARRDEAAPETLAAEARVQQTRRYPIWRWIFAAFLGLAILRYVEMQIRGY